MRAGIALLIIAYCFSQFFRAALAVLTPALGTDIGAAPDDLALASGLWFLAFALMQIPVGAALDRIGPRLTSAVIFTLGTGAGAAMFALAQTPVHVTLAMVLIGVGCSPILMAAYFIFARSFPPAAFATLAGLTIGLGSFGNVAGSAPLAWAVEQFGWRGTMWGLAALAIITGIALAVVIRDPPRAEDAAKGSVLDVLRVRALWPIFAMILVSYAATASVRGLWVGPYLRDVFGADAALIGRVTLFMGLAMIAGSFAYGPLDRVFGTRKWVTFCGNALTALTLGLICLFPQSGIVTATVLLAAAGFFGASFPMIMAHGRTFIPAHLTGRGVTLLNLFSIGGTGLMQIVTAQVWRSADARIAAASGPYVVLFGFITLTLLLGLVVYARSAEGPVR